MNTLILKLNATGDVVRTTPLLGRLEGDVTWITADSNLSLLFGISEGLRVLGWSEREAALDRRYDLVINLEDEGEVADFLSQATFDQVFGAYRDDRGQVVYTSNAASWFDLSLISAYGREKADELKFRNRRSYQDHLFGGMGFEFKDDPYLLPPPTATDLEGDVAVAPVAGPVWPMKNWAFYDELIDELRGRGLTVNVLPHRPTLLEHLADVANHRCLVSGDSLPMHFALGTGTRCVTIFNCTSPWEIHDYGLQQKLVSPLLGEFFYKRGKDERATRAIHLDSVLESTMACLREA